MTTHPSIPPADALPDELLLDLVEGTLRSSDVDRVRAALKRDPKLAKRLEAMRTDRREMTALGDPGVSAAPVGLVADAIGLVERDSLLDGAPYRSTGSGFRRLAPALIAACVGIVAVGAWYAHSEGVLFAPDEATPTQIVKAPTKEDDVVGPNPDEPVEYASRQRTLQDYDEKRAPFEIAKDLPGHLPGSFGVLDAPKADGFSNDPSVGGPVDPDLFAQDVVSDTPPTVEQDALWSAPGQMARTPDAIVPAEAALWAREGVLRIVVSPAGEGRLEDFEQAAARKLFIAYDPTMSKGWGMTSLPTIRATNIASSAGPGRWRPEVDAVTSERPMIATLRVDRDTTDDDLQRAIDDMAQGMRAITGLRVTLERGETPSSPTDAGGPALTVDDLLWWRKPASLWTPARVYHLPVVARD